jgi:hypothetical protein
MDAVVAEVEEDVRVGDGSQRLRHGDGALLGSFLMLLLLLLLLFFTHIFLHNLLSIATLLFFIQPPTGLPHTTDVTISRRLLHLFFQRFPAAQLHQTLTLQRHLHPANAKAQSVKLYLFQKEQWAGAEVVIPSRVADGGCLFSHTCKCCCRLCRTRLSQNVTVLHSGTLEHRTWPSTLLRGGR